MKNWNSFWIAVTVLIIFASGIAAGVLLETYVLDSCKAKRERAKKPEPVRFPTLEIMAEELDLTTEQQEQIREIFRNNEERLKVLRHQIHQQFDSLRNRLLKDIKSVLNQEQCARFEAMIQKYLEERQKMERERRDRPNRPEAT